MTIVSVQASTQRSEVQYALSNPQKLHIDDNVEVLLAGDNFPVALVADCNGLPRFDSQEW